MFGIALAPHTMRVDTLHIAGPNSWDGRTGGVNDNRAKRISFVVLPQGPRRMASTSFNILMPSGEPFRYLAPSPSLFGPVVSSIYADGTFLLPLVIDSALDVPPEWHRPVLTGSIMAYVRVASNGVAKALVAWTPAPPPCGTTLVVLCGRVFVNVRSDGGEIAFASAATSGADSGMIVVTVMNASGDMVFARKYRYEGIPMPQQYADSILAALFKGNASGHRTPFRATVFPPIASLLIGDDGTIWITRRELGGTRSLLVLDAKGVPWGTLRLPANIWILSADSTGFWATEHLAGQANGNIVRFAVARRQ